MPTVMASLSAGYSILKSVAATLTFGKSLPPRIRQVSLPLFIRRILAPSMVPASLRYVGTYFSKDARGFRE